MKNKLRLSATKCRRSQLVFMHYHSLMGEWFTHCLLLAALNGCYAGEFLALDCFEKGTATG